MKKSLVKSAVFCLLLASCSKEALVTPNAVLPDESSARYATGSEAISNAINPTGFLGEYWVRDAKTIFKGQANPKGTNEFIHLDYIDVKKTVLPTADKKHLTMPYGPSNYVDSGWAYIIDYNAATKTITLSPNEAMIEDIVPGSFETRFAAYDPKTKSGSFVTRFTALSDKGNETEITENLFKE